MSKKNKVLVQFSIYVFVLFFFTFQSGVFFPLSPFALSFLLFHFLYQISLFKFHYSPKAGAKGHLRDLQKISPYLDCLKEYSAVIEVFAQVKPDIIALIWGPIKLLLQWTSVMLRSFDAITKTLCEIGDLLPEFKRVTKLFSEHVILKEVLALFFQDILVSILHCLFCLTIAVPPSYPVVTSYRPCASRVECVIYISF